MAKSGCCGWDVWGEMSGLGTVGRDRALAAPLGSEASALRGTPSENASGRLLVEETQKSHEDR
jgi:hypothetical protein